MKRKLAGILLIAAVILAGFVLFGFHRHDWLEATCTSPMTCESCGKTKGESLGHDWVDADCEIPKTCSVCGETEGDALGHVLSEANYQEAGICEVCGKNEGTPVPGWFETHSVACGTEADTAYGYSTVSREDEGLKVSGNVIMTHLNFFEADEEHPYAEGYEWINARFELIFNSRDAWRNGLRPGWTSLDYYDPALQLDTKVLAEDGMSIESYTVDYKGAKYDQCAAYLSQGKENDIQYAIQSTEVEAYIRIPKDYDGAVVAFYDTSADVQGSLESGNLDTLIENGTYFRLSKEEGKESGITVLSSCLPVKPGETIEAESIVRCGDGCEYGFSPLNKVGELKDIASDRIWNNAPVYETVSLPDETGFSAELEIPNAEGVYETTVMVKEKEGSITSVPLTIVADGGNPDIHLPDEYTLMDSEGFTEEIYGTDNFYDREDCSILSLEGVKELIAAVKSGTRGTYKIDYKVTDPSGNISARTVSLTVPDASLENTEYFPNIPPQTAEAPDNVQTTETPNNVQTANTAPVSGQFMESMGREALRLVNQYRSEIGCGQLAWSSTLYAAAQVRAQELVISFSHTRPGGGDYTGLLSGYMAMGENIAYGQTSASAVYDAWYASEGHRQNMAFPSFSQGAIACWYENGVYYWVNLFGG